MARHPRFDINAEGPLFTKRQDVLPQDLVKSLNLWDSGLGLNNRSDMWQAPRQQRYRDACQISERYDQHNIISNHVFSRLHEICRQDVYPLVTKGPELIPMIFDTLNNKIHHLQVTQVVHICDEIVNLWIMFSMKYSLCIFIYQSNQIWRFIWQLVLLIKQCMVYTCMLEK